MVRPARLIAFVSVLAIAGTAMAQPRYHAVIESELEALGVEATCEAEAALRTRCAFRHVSRDGTREIWVRLTYSDESDTLYIFVPRLAVAAPEDVGTPQVLRRLAELNWRMLGTKLEWNGSNGEVRISAVLHTDSNFDRRAFRGLVRLVIGQAERYQPELERLLRND